MRGEASGLLELAALEHRAAVVRIADLVVLLQPRRLTIGQKASLTSPRSFQPSAFAAAMTASLNGPNASRAALRSAASRRLRGLRHRRAACAQSSSACVASARRRRLEPSDLVGGELRVDLQIRSDDSAFDRHHDACSTTMQRAASHRCINRAATGRRPMLTGNVAIMIVEPSGSVEPIRAIEPTLTRTFMKPASAESAACSSRSTAAPPAARPPSGTRARPATAARRS